MTELTILSEKLNLLINTIEEAIQNIRKQHFWKTSYQLKNISAVLAETLPLFKHLPDKSLQAPILENLKEILAAQACSDYVLLGDLLEIKLLPSLYDIQAAVLADISCPFHDFFDSNLKLLSEENCENPASLISSLARWKHKVSSFSLEPYQIEPTNSGSLTLKKTYQASSCYFHSNQNPWREAEIFAQSCCEEGIFHYVIVGMGLGYHAVRLLQKDSRYQITVLEPDINILGCAFQYINLAYPLSQNRFQLIFSPDLRELKKYTDTQQYKLLIHYPTMTALQNQKAKKLLQNYFLQMSSVEEQRQSLEENFYYNLLRRDDSIDSLRQAFYNKTILYLGGGPSTETKLPYIQNYLQENPHTVTICAGKVYRQLTAQSFIPDYVLITDPKPSLLWQLKDIAPTRAKLLYLSTASHNAVKAFCGNTIIVFQNGTKDSENYAKENGLTLFETGGSVSTTAIDIALRLKCRKLITAGLDLSYPEKKSHAFGISGNVTNHASYICKKDIYGKEIITTPVFEAYRKWIEKRIVESPGIKLMNLTDGIPIKGMDNRSRL